MPHLPWYKVLFIVRAAVAGTLFLSYKKSCRTCNLCEVWVGRELLTLTRTRAFCARPRRGYARVWPPTKRVVCAACVCGQRACIWGWRVFSVIGRRPYMCKTPPWRSLGGVVIGNGNEPRRGSICGYRKKRGDVSRVMWPAWNGRLSVIYLGAELPPRSSSLPPGNGRAVLKCRYT